MNRYLVLVLSFFTLFLLIGGAVSAETGPGVNAGTGSSPDMVKPALAADKGKVKVDSFVIKQGVRVKMDVESNNELRARFTNTTLSEDDLRRLVMANIDASDLGRLDAAGRERLLSALRVRITGDEVSRFREVEVRLKERDTRVEEIRKVRDISDERLRAIARLKIVESTLTGDDLVRIKALRAKLEASTSATVADADRAKVEDEVRREHRKNADVRGEDAVEKAEAILAKLESFADRIDSKLSASDVPRPRAENILTRLRGLITDLSTSIDATKVSLAAIQEEDASAEAIRTLHKDLIRMRVDAKQATSAIHALIQAFKNRPEGSDDIRAEDEAAIVDIATISDVEVEAEVTAVLSETEPSDDSSMETDDSGADSASDNDDSDEDQSTESDDTEGDDQ